MNKHGSKWIRPKKRAQIYARDRHLCVYCGSGDRFSLDHLVPRELGGSNHASNLVTACHLCNSTRRNLSLRTWLRQLRRRGIDTVGLARRIRRHVARVLR